MYFSDIVLYIFDSVNRIFLFLLTVFLRFQGCIPTAAATLLPDLSNNMYFSDIVLYFFDSVNRIFFVSVSCISQIPRLHSNGCRHGAARFIRSRNKTKNFRFLWHPIAKSGPAQFEMENKTCWYMSHSSILAAMFWDTFLN